MKLAELLAKGRALGASDLHLVQGEIPVFRVNGQLLREGNRRLEARDLEDILAELLPGGEGPLPDDLRERDFAWKDPVQNRYRVNIHRQMETFAVSIRIIRKFIPPMAELGLPGAAEELLALESGLVLVTGATGSGKSTTLAALVETLNHTRALNIITIEDPVEYVFNGDKSLIRQREIGRDTASFQAALRSALRQDPDVILVGEMRDLESIEAAITVAETGHLVLGTLHTTGAVEAVDRIIDVFPKEKQSQIRLQVASVLKAVVNQQLIPGVSGSPVLACEILRNTPAVASYILQGRTNQIPSLLESGQKNGMVSMRKSLEALYKTGKIDEIQYKKRMP